MIKRLQSSNGISIIEAILVVVFLSMGLFGVMTVTQNTLLNDFSASNNFLAAQLCAEKLEQVLIDKKMNGYAVVQESRYPSEDLTGSYTGYTRTTHVYNVLEDEIDVSSETDTGVKRIVVNVSHTSDPDGLVAISTLITDY